MRSDDFRSRAHFPHTGTDESAAGVDTYAPDVGINDFNNSQASPYTTAVAAIA
jgi:hypothetical protein